MPIEIHLIRDVGAFNYQLLSSARTNDSILVHKLTIHRGGARNLKMQRIMFMKAMFANSCKLIEILKLLQTHTSDKDRKVP